MPRTSPRLRHRARVRQALRPFRPHRAFRVLLLQRRRSRQILAPLDKCSPGRHQNASPFLVSKSSCTTSGKPRSATGGAVLPGGGTLLLMSGCGPRGVTILGHLPGPETLRLGSRCAAGEIVNRYNKQMARDDGRLPTHKPDPKAHSPKPRRPQRAVAQRTIGEHSPRMHRSGGMTDPWMRAQDWLSRADELRELAGRTEYRAVRTALLDMAASFNDQAANLAELALRLRSAHRPQSSETDAPPSTAD